MSSNKAHGKSGSEDINPRLSLESQVPSTIANEYENSLSRRQFLRNTAIAVTAVGFLGSIPGLVDVENESKRDCGSGAVIECPVRGEWTVLNPPGHTDRADDFIGMQEAEILPYSGGTLPRHLSQKIPVTQAFGWDRPVFSPVEGTVVEVSNDEPDAKQLNLLRDAAGTLLSPPDIEGDDIRPAAGNYVVIESEGGVSFLAHLRRGSITVSEGMQVVAGQQLGNVGNSGASVFPHLHYQLMDRWPVDLAEVEASLLPYRFSKYELLVGGFLSRSTWDSVSNCRPEQFDRIRIQQESE